MPQTKEWVHPPLDKIQELLSELPKILRPDQHEVADKLASLSGPGIFIAPPGWGKTLTFLESIRRVSQREPKFVGVVFEPRIGLCCQTIAAAVAYLIDQHNERWGIVMVSSGKPYRRTQEKLNKLCELSRNEPILSTTTPEKLANQVRRLSDSGLKVLVVSTYHSNRVVRSSGINFHVKVNDECHNLVTKSDTEGFRGTHDVPANATISTTASPENTDSEEDDAIGMQNEALWGPILESVSPNSAMDNKIILPQRLDYVDIALDEGRLNDPIDEDFAKIVDFLFSTVDQNDSMIKSFAKDHAKLIGAKVLFGLPGQFWLRGIMGSLHLTELMKERKDINLVALSSSEGVYVWPAGASTPEHYAFTGEGKDELFSFIENLLPDEKLIWMHIRTVGEGVDYPPLTGFCPLCDLPKTRVIQDCNRPGRLCLFDRHRQIVQGDIPDGEWVKPFAIVHLPYCIEGGSDVVAAFENILRDMRSDPNFDPSTMLVDAKKSPAPKEKPVRDPDPIPRGNPYDQTAEFWHSCEKEDADDRRHIAARDLRNAVHRNPDAILEMLEGINHEG